MIIKKNSPELFDILKKTLQNNGTAIFPCDTIYGIMGRYPNLENKIQKIKERGNSRPFLKLISDTGMMKSMTSQDVDKRILSYWPGPLTLILKTKRKEEETIALRIPNDPFLLKLIKSLNFPLISTSVNRSGDVFLREITKIIEFYKDKVDLIVDAGDLPKKIPSTLLDISSKPYKVLRQGECLIPEEILKSAL